MWLLARFHICSSSGRPGLIALTAARSTHHVPDPVTFRLVAKNRILRDTHAGGVAPDILAAFSVATHML